MEEERVIRATWALRALGVLLIQGTVAAAGPQEITNGATPAEGRATLTLEEQWRVGADEEDVLLGVIRDVEIGPSGEFYLLDSQLSQVHVFSPTGDYLQSLSREGEGPGECRQPVDLVLLSPQEIGIVQGFPGKMIKLDVGGMPLGTVQFGSNDPTQGGFRFVQDVRARGGLMAYAGTEMRQTDEGMHNSRFIAYCSTEGVDRTRILEREGGDPVRTGKWVEADEYFPMGGRWALGPQGRFFVATERDRYAIEVYDRDGRRERVITRDFEPRKRTAAEKEGVEGISIVANGEAIAIDNVIADYEPCIGSLHVMDDGELWVAHSRSADDPPAGVMLTYDVFAPDGRFVRQVSIACEGVAEEDRLFPLDEGRFALVRGFSNSLRIEIGGGDSPDEAPVEDLAPLQVIYYTSG